MNKKRVLFSMNISCKPHLIKTVKKLSNKGNQSSIKHKKI